MYKYVKKPTEMATVIRNQWLEKGMIATDAATPATIAAPIGRINDSRYVFKRIEQIGKTKNFQAGIIDTPARATAPAAAPTIPHRAPIRITAGIKIALDRFHIEVMNNRPVPKSSTPRGLRHALSSPHIASNFKTIIDSDQFFPRSK